MVPFFPPSIHLVPLHVIVVVANLLTQFIRHFIRWWVGSSGAEGFVAKNLLLASSRPTNRLTLPLTMASVHLVLLNLSWCVSVLFQTDHWIDLRSNQSDRRFIRCYCLLLLCFLQSSSACRNWTIGSSDGVFCCILCVFNLPLLNMSSLT
jgi:hypothetical protein